MLLALGQSLGQSNGANGGNGGVPPSNPTNAIIIYNDTVSRDGGITWSNVFNPPIWLYTSQFANPAPSSLFVMAVHQDTPKNNPYDGPNNKALYIYWGTNAAPSFITNQAAAQLVYIPDGTNAGLIFKPTVQFVPKSP